MSEIVDPEDGSPLADRDVRLLAVVLDQGLASLAVAPVVLLYVAISPTPDTATMPVAAGQYLTVAVLGAFVVLQYWLLSVRGQTLGKIAMGIRIERPDGSLPGFGRVVVLRSWLVGLLSGICGVFSLVDVLFILSADRRTLHDRIADTRVVQLEGGPW